MRYVMIFLAVLVVLLLMIAFMFLVIRQVSDRVTGQVNGRYMRELSVFDRLYEEKKKKLEELEEKERLYGVNLMKKDAPAKNPAKVQTVAETPAAGLELPPASTGQTDFGEAYRNVRNEFAVTEAQRSGGSFLWIRVRWQRPEKRPAGSLRIFRSKLHTVFQLSIRKSRSRS